ncbi:MAG: NAD-dependent epimerase/dehydratase family protein [Acidobacteriia bacterium]|nr:NAD-dependent epimerase/dehydratase family protein [Terriglobia bacterium]
MDLEKSFADKRVLITGGLGFIGSNLAHRLVGLGAKIMIVDSLIPEYGGNIFNVSGIEDVVQISVSDIRDRHAMRYLVQRQDYIFSLAGQVSHLDSVEDPITDLEINCRAQVNLLEACRQQNTKVKIVFASTRQIYGRPRYLPVDEKHPIAPVDPNGINKMAGEHYYLLYWQLYRLATCSLRLTNTYGPRMRVCDARQTFIGWWFRQILQGDEIRVYGDGHLLRDFNFVDDVVEAFLLAAAAPKSNGQIYNLGAEPVSLEALAAMMVELYGGGSFRLVPFPEERKMIDIGDYRGDYRKIASELGWQPIVPLREGLRRALDYYRRYSEQYW